MGSKIYNYIDEKIESRRNETLKDFFENKNITKDLKFYGLEIYDNSSNFKNNLRMLLSKSEIDDDIVLSQIQIEILNILNNKENLFLSAPTSFGKTFITLEYIKKNKALKNIIFIVPTIALMNEILKKMNKYFAGEFNIYTSIPEEFADKNILILIPERLNEIKNDTLQKIKIDLAIIDEIYKLSKSIKDKRKILFNKTYLNLISNSKQVILLGPYIRNVELKKTIPDITKFFTNLSFVYNQTINIDDEFFWNNIVSKKKKIIYVNKPETIFQLTNEIIEKVEISDYYVEKYSEEIKYLSDNFNKDWDYIKMLQRGIAIHYGSTPKFLRSFFEDEYRNGEINTIICTSTLLEGVNTPTSELIIYEAPDNPFQLTNLIGRVGRLNTKKPIIGRILTMNNTLKPIMSNENWMDLEILAEGEFADNIDEHIFLNKEIKENKINNELQQLQEIAKANNFTIEDVKKYNVKFKKIKDFDDKKISNKLVSSKNLHNCIESVISFLGKQSENIKIKMANIYVTKLWSEIYY